MDLSPSCPPPPPLRCRAPPPSPYPFPPPPSARPATPRDGPCLGETAAQQAAHAVHKRESNACQGPNTGPGRFSQKTGQKRTRPSESQKGTPPRKRDAVIRWPCGQGIRVTPQTFAGTANRRGVPRCLCTFHVHVLRGCCSQEGIGWPCLRRALVPDPPS